MAWRVVGWRRSGRLIDEGGAALIHGLETGTRASARRSGYALSDGTVYRTYVMSARRRGAPRTTPAPCGCAGTTSTKRHDEYEAT